MFQKAQFLENLGLSRGDSAAILGTTAASLSELKRQAKRKSEASKSGKAQKSSARKTAKAVKVRA
jgi:transcriptional regulator